MEEIKLNQLGYRPNETKKAVIPCNPAEEGVHEFSLINKTDNTVIYKGRLSDSVYCEASGETVRIADFTCVNQPGEYFIKTDSLTPNPQTLIIAETPYRQIRKALLDFFDYQKCGVELDAGIWSHPACHTSPAYILDKNGKKTGEIKDVSGGWHDAGDYGRYVVPAAQTVVQLLLGYEFTDGGVGVKDENLLEITWFEIEWMLKMQDEHSGGVYHKVSCYSFDPIDEMPDKELGELVICPVSAEATADFAATMALASRFYPKHKNRLLQAAGCAWEWCMETNEKNFQNPNGVTTGPYSNSDINSKYFWAACELYAATGEKSYHDYIRHNKAAEIRLGVDWQKSGTYGIYAYATSKFPTVTELRSHMINLLLCEAAKIAEKCKEEPYGISVGTTYRWGSNWDLANNAMTLLLAGFFDENKNNEYREHALEHFHYMVGKNALNQCYISGFGSNPVKNPHHRPSVAVGKAVPGMVAGGANGQCPERDAVLHKRCAGQPPMKCYTDHTESFSSNEITVYWNSPVYFLAAALGF